jgi:hypothetical protein
MGIRHVRVARLEGMTLVVFLLGLLASTLCAQETTGKLEGRAVDVRDQPIARAHVTATSSALQGTREAVTDAQGRFVLLALPVGEYSVTLRHEGHTPQVVEGVLVRLGQTTSLGDVRVPDVIRIEQEVTVSGPAPLVDPASTYVGANMRSQEFVRLPIDRDYRSVALLLPEANQSFLGDAMNFGGATGLENRYFIDGMDVTDPYRALNGGTLPYNFIKEVEVRSGGYEAEYRASLGGVLNVVTWSGGNDLHGEVFGFFMNDRVSATPRLGTLQPDRGSFARYDIGLAVGGPIMKDRLWFYAAYDPAFERFDGTIPGLGVFPDRSTTHSFAGKLTWRAADRHTITLSTLGDPMTRDAVASPAAALTTTPVSFANPDPYLERITFGTTGLLLEGQHVLSDNLLLNTRLSRVWWWQSNEGRTERGRTEPLFIDAETGRWSGGAPDDMHNRSTVTTAGLSASWMAGRHLVKGGLEYEDNSLSVVSVGGYVECYPSSVFSQFVFNADFAVANRILSGFVQDSWRLGSRLRANIGVRWDGQFFISSEGNVAQTILDQWQPRLGLAWMPGGTGQHKVSGSFGRFYQEVSTYPLAFNYNIPPVTVDFINYDHDPRLDPTGGAVWHLGPTGIQSRMTGMQGQFFDEVNVGYERQFSGRDRLAVRGIDRHLRQGIEKLTDPATGQGVLGNPGRGLLRAYPRVKRNYTALEISYQRTGARAGLMASYVLSRNYGNYTGLFSSDSGQEFPNSNFGFSSLETLVNAEGLLPNDRTHVAKLSGHYQPHKTVTFGAFGLWEQGTPLSELGGATSGPPFYTFLRQRGTAGRTPTIWDLNLRASYAPSSARLGRWRPRLLLDVLHVASPRRVVSVDQVHYFMVDADGKQIDPNPTYGLATRFQPPMALRFGLEVGF